ncbi:hypothetical protein EON65_38165, partial [archaeon]
MRSTYPSTYMNAYTTSHPNQYLCYVYKPSPPHSNPLQSRDWTPNMQNPDVPDRIFNDTPYLGRDGGV